MHTLVDSITRCVPQNTTVPRQLVYGRDEHATRRGLVLGVVLFVLSYLFWRLPGVSDTAYDVLPVDVIGGGFALVVLVAAVHAARNRGLLVSWLLVFLPVLGATMNFVGVGLQSPTPGEQIMFIVAIPLAAALLLGTAGYLVGRGVAHVLQSAGEPPGADRSR